MSVIIDKETVRKYDVPGPRYTSYPTAPEWSSDMNHSIYEAKLREAVRNDKTLSLYIHIPFCESLCYFCACMMAIRRQDEKYGDEYLQYLSKEIDLLRNTLGKKAKVKQLHWGGGTPTFLNEDQIERLFKKISDNFKIDFNGEIAIEIDPRRVEKIKLETLRRLGFNRISLGVQDFDPKVQETINRVQPFEMVERVTQWCRELKFVSVNFDLIYGLPKQTKESFTDTINKVLTLRPDRIALYSFAYLPWLKKHQAKVEVEGLPSRDEKLDIFLQARATFLQNGYQAIAMDHFALKEDELAQAFNAGTLYRNFMGYTVKPADEYIGLGVSSIGFLENTFVQNQKTIPEYYKAIDGGYLPIARGKILSNDDQIRQWVIHSLMCRFKVDTEEFLRTFQHEFDTYFQEEAHHIEKCVFDGLLYLDNRTLKVTDLGKLFIRNICMGFDWYLRQKTTLPKFSQTV